MKLIKIEENYFVIKNENGDVLYSTQPLITNEVGNDGFEFDHNSTYPPTTVLPLSLSEVKELIGEVDVEKKAYDYVNKKDFSDDAFRGYKAGYQAAIEDNKGKVYTEEDVLNILYDYDNVDWSKREHKQSTLMMREWLSEKLQPPTSWDVEFVNGKLKLV